MIQAEEQQALEEVFRDGDIVKTNRQAVLLRAIDRNLEAQQKKLGEIQAATRATLRFVTSTEEQKAKKKELSSAIRKNRAAQKITLEKIRATAEIEKDSQRVIDLKIELRNLRTACRKLVSEIKRLGSREEEDKEPIVSSEDEENPSA